MFMICFTPLCLLSTVGILYHKGYERLYVRIARWIFDYQGYASRMPDNVEIISRLIFTICLWVYAVFSSYLHEGLHVIACPRQALKESKVYLRFGFFKWSISVDAVISRRNFLLISILPVLTFSIIYAVLWLFTKDTMILLPLQAINLASSSKDIATFFFILFKIPNRHYLHGLGFNGTYYKKTEKVQATSEPT